MLDPLPGDIFVVGQVLNNTYEIEGVLGRGGTGEVYRARNQVSGRIVAIKALSAQFSGNADYVELMKREEEMRSIHHDAVVRYTECSRTQGGQVVLVMDFISGEALSDVMASRRIDVRELLIIAHRVAEGLVATHAHGIVHRDLSPDNIILRDGNPEKATIIDFGIAKDTAAGARTIVGGEFAGKYEYAAPEQLEGRADARSDLYGLGATLLAAWHGEAPFAGSTPGEIVRRKQAPLDTSMLKEPLRSLITDLVAPDPAKRPASATAVVARIDTLLRPERTRPDAGSGSLRNRQPRRRSGARWLMPVILALALLVGGAWYSGVIAPLLPQKLPLAQPYVLTAALAPPAPPLLDGNVPTEAAGQQLREAFRTATGTLPEAGQLTLADGQPVASWPDSAARLLGALGGLAQWEMSISDLSVTLNGLAPDAATRDRVLAALDDWTVAGGMTLDATIAAGPALLSQAQVAAIVAPLATCGPLAQPQAPAAGYGLNDPVVVAGNVAQEADAAALRGALQAAAGDRPVELRAQVLGEDPCAIRRVLPPVSSGAVSVVLSNGATGTRTPSGIFTTGENPVVDVLVPAAITQGSLWVMAVDNGGKVFHILPNINHEAHDLAGLGEVEGGVRRIRVLYSLDQFRADSSLAAIRISNENYGKSEIVVILTEKPLFDGRRPTEESVASTAEALQAALTGAGNVIGVATQVIDARP